MLFSVVKVTAELKLKFKHTFLFVQYPVNQ